MRGTVSVPGGLPMAFATRELHPHIGAEIRGLDLRQPIDEATVKALWRAIDTHAVLVFPDQQMSDAQLRALAAPFGGLWIGRSAARGRKRALHIPPIAGLS